MRQHRGVPAVEFELHQRREQGADFGHHEAFVLFRPALRHGEINTIGVGFEQRHAAGSEFAAHQPERFPAAPRHFVGGVHIGESRQSAARRQVAIGGVHHQLHGR